MDTRFYKDALFVQSACNGRGVINSLRDVVSEARKDAPVLATEQPVLTLFVDKLADLCNAREMEVDPLILADILVLVRDVILGSEVPWHPENKKMDSKAFHGDLHVRTMVHLLYKSLSINMDKYSNDYQSIENYLRDKA